MGGKRYFCDYCQCYLINDVNIRKTHNDAVTHKINKIRYMRKFEDPLKVYEEEIKKPPCQHFLKGRCRYDLFCQSTHYTPKQLEELKLLAEKAQQKSMSTKINETTTHHLFKHLLPWSKNALQKKKLTKKKNQLPPSLRSINLKKLTQIENDTTWG
ncbi:zinc finger matrin-type protein 5 [Musca autumnalis]|uniref:zinc finger matrin-type protein 5 n=1 Tax=Musca autumnalis TaxID=221902 RepID=UPI003CEBF1D8